MPFVYRLGPFDAERTGDQLIEVDELLVDGDGLLIPPDGYAVDADGLVIVDFAWETPPFTNPIPWRIDLCVGWERVATCTAYQFLGTQRKNAAGSFVLESSPQGAPAAIGFDPRDIDTVRLVGGNRVLYAGYVAGDDGGFWVEQDDDGERWRWTGEDIWWLLRQGQALPDPTMESGWTVSHDTRTGVASSVLAEYLDFNMGASALPAAQVPGFQVVDEIVGPTQAFSARFDTLEELAQRLAYTGGFVVSPEVDFDGVITIRLAAPRDLSSIVVFSDKGDLLSSRARFQHREANWVIAGGSGEGTSRIFRTATTSETPRRRLFVDVSSLTTGPEVQAAANQALALANARYAVNTELSAAIADVAIRYGLRLGDKLGIGIDERRYDLPIEAVTFNVSPGRQIMTPQFGDAIPDELVRLLRKVDRPTFTNIA